MSKIAGLTYYLSPIILKRGAFPGATNSVFDNIIGWLVAEESTLSTAYVTIGFPVLLTAYRYGFPTLGTYAYQLEFYVNIKTSDAALTAYVRYIRDALGGGSAIVLGEDTHTGDTNWNAETYLLTTPPTTAYSYYLQLMISAAPGVAYAKHGEVLLATIVGGGNHGFFVLRG